MLLKKITRLFALYTLPFVASLLIRFLYITNKKVFHIPEECENEPTIYACWHGELLMFSHAYLHLKKNPHAKVFISSHFDGMLIAKTIQKFGLQIMHGSSNRNAAKVLIQGIKAIKEGYDIGITPDGPKGPRHSVADGIMVMAKKTKAKVVLVSIKSTSYWQFHSWDKFVIPKPFGTIHFYYSKSLEISHMELEEARQYIKEGLLKHEK